MFPSVSFSAVSRDPFHRPITRRRLLANGLGAAAWMALGCDSGPEHEPSTPPAAPPAPARPNLVLFMTDDQSWDEIGYASSGRVATPNLDRMASEGTTFRNAYCAAIPCVPSRSSMMSGLNFHRWRVGNRLNPFLKQGTWTWSHALRSAGYETVLVGKMHLFPRDGNHGFDRRYLCDPMNAPGGRRAPPRDYDDYERWLASEGKIAELDRTNPPKLLAPQRWPLDARYHRVSWVRDRAIEYLETRSLDRPFALVVSFLAPHLPYDPPEPYASMYPPDSIELPTDRWTDLQGMPASLAREQNVGWRRDRFRPEHLQRMISAYRGLVSEVDEAIGAVAKRIDRYDTMVLFASDHGDFLGKRGRLVKSPSVPFEPLARIPMLAYGAGVPNGAVVDHPVSLVDVAPTWLVAAGLKVPRDLDGEPLQPVLQSHAGAARVVYCLGPTYFHMVRRGEFKYLRSEDGTEEMLFDLTADPGEVRNLAGEPPVRDARADLSAALDQILSRPRPRLPTFFRTPDAAPLPSPREA
jgi:arylsulfatase